LLGNSYQLGPITLPGSKRQEVVPPEPASPLGRMLKRELGTLPPLLLRE
jgi:hypothetical protein